MPNVSERQVEADIAANELMLNNALNDPVIRALLEERGYITEKFNEGLAKVQNTQAKQVAKDVARGNQLAATDAFKAAAAAARRVYTDFRETARAHFGSEAQNREAWQKLGLGGTVPLDTEKFIGAAYTTFDSVLADEAMLTELTPYKYDTAGVQASRAVIEAMAAANQAQERAKGDSQRATAERDAAYRDMKAWMSTFKRIARRALFDRPDLLVKLGL